MANNTNSRDPITQADIERYSNMMIKVRMVSGDSIGTWKAKATIVLDGLLTSTIIKPHMVQIIA